MQAFRQQCQDGVLAARLAAMLVVAAVLTLAGAVAPQARTLTVRGTETDRFARIQLEFDQPTKVSARATPSVIVLSFSRPVRIKTERLMAELRNYVAQIRHDPDGTGLRLALIRPMRVNILEAGEKIFVDLLPGSWAGLPPGLPPDVVEDLARRAREAEAKLRDETVRRQKEGPKSIGVRVSRLPTLTRLTFDAPMAVPVSLKTEGNDVEILFDAPLRLETGDAKGRLAPAVLGLHGETAESVLRVSLALADGYEVRSFREDETFVVDVAKSKSAEEAAETPTPFKPLSGADESAASQQRTQTEPATATASPAVKANAPPPEVQASPPAPAQPSAPVRPSVTAGPDGLAIAFPFAARTAAAAFERSGLVTAVFHSTAPIAFGAWPPAAQSFAEFVGVKREGAFTTLRLQLKGPHLVRLAPQNGGWVLTLGDKGLMPSEPLAVQRSVDESGRTVVAIPLADASGVHWLEEPAGGERIAVATAFGSPQGIAKPQRFVEFSLLPTAHGLAIAAEADDVTVRSGVDGVGISRGAGLAVSLGDGSKGPSGGLPDLALTRERWQQDRLGAVRERGRALMQQAAEAPRSGRGEARLDLARFLIANGLDHEAAGVLSVAGDDDPALARQRPLLLLQGIAWARMGREAEAKRALASDVIAEDFEALLWRALLDTRAGRWSPALVGFRRSAAVTELYPEDLQVIVRTAAVRAALEMKDFAYAESELTAADRLAPEGLARDRIALLRARLDEASGRSDAALDHYGKLAEAAERPVAAEATLRLVSLAQREKTMTPDEAIARLETLSMIWRGDDIEIGTLGLLGRLYAENARWREAFTIARRANRIFPDHEITRTLHEETSRLFEGLFLTGKGDTLTRVESLALYFDFKEFTPIGRRGDEIVRRLVDRLIELDLLDQAGDLLQHQVDNRLSGAARATVAARLATVRLMDGKPQAALAAIQATRLPELPISIKRARILLEARALSDLSRTDLALEVLDGEAGVEIERLRADILWNGRRWREAGEAHERLVGMRWRGPEALSDQDRSDAMRAAIAYSLGDEPLALDRLRTKFAAKMADSADARTFGFLTRPNVAATQAFREIARGVTSADTLADFLAEYRKRYPEAAVAARRRQPAEAPEPSPAKPQAQAPAGEQTPKT
jgi:tetratricopeptide (TPR) repeat protein